MADIVMVERRSRRNKQIIVLGAGMAGLTAAYQLNQVGHDVTVLEARDRVGGKVLTMRSPDHSIDPPFLGEAGAMVLLPELPLPFLYAAHLGVQHEEVAIRGQELHLRGGSIGDGNDHRRWPRSLAIRKNERTLGASKMWRKYYGAIARQLGNPRDARWSAKKQIAAYDHVTLTQFLRARGASAGAVEILRLRRHELMGDGFDAGSALQWLRETALFRPVPGVRLRYFPGGCDQLPQAFAARLATHGAKIHLSKPVVEIEQKGSRIAAICRGENGPERFEGDEMICTIPFSVLRALKLPEMTREKRRAIDLQRHTSVFRAYLQTSAPAWALADITFTDRLPMLVSPAERRHTGTTKGLLEVYVAGRYARALQALGKNERIERLLDEVEALSPGFRARYENKYAAYCWDEDQWSRGAYPWYGPGEVTSIASHAATPVGRLHFAGEHTSLVPGWMQGAIESGERAAAEVA